MAAHDAAGVKSCAHNIKGSARTAGANELAWHSAALEVAAEAGDGPEAERCLEAMRAAFPVVEAAIKTIRIGEGVW